MTNDTIEMNAVDDSPLTDRELLEAAARAAGIPGVWDQRITGHGIAVPGECKPVWNPLTDDGDALRLSRALKMTVAFEPSRGGWSAGAIVMGEFRWLAHDDDQRRAITRAAAEHARRTMPFNEFILLFPYRFAPERVERARQLVAGREVQS